MFPDAASDAMPLHRCMRFLPHHQDTGGFFVCVLEKVRPPLTHTPPAFSHTPAAALDGSMLVVLPARVEPAKLECSPEGGNISIWSVP